MLLCADLLALHVLGFSLPSTSSSTYLVAWGMWATDSESLMAWGMWATDSESLMAWGMWATDT